MDPSTGEVSKTAPGSLGYPKGCPNCKKLTEVRGVTASGLLVSGAKEFWVRGGWFSRKVAPKGTEPKSGVPASVSSGHVLAKWQKKKGAKDAATHELWAVHALDTGKAVAQVRCRKPAIDSGAEPQLLSSPDGRYLVAGRLAFDLDEKTAFCFEETDGTKPLTLTSVADTGVAYGATSARTVADALSGGGNPVQVNLATGEPEPLALNVRLPAGDANGMGLFRWTDGKDRLRLIAYARRGELTVHRPAEGRFRTRPRFRPRSRPRSRPPAPAPKPAQGPVSSVVAARCCACQGRHSARKQTSDPAPQATCTTAIGTAVASPAIPTSGEATAPIRNDAVPMRADADPAACGVRISARALVLGIASPIADIRTNSPAATGRGRCRRTPRSSSGAAPPRRA